MCGIQNVTRKHGTYYYRKLIGTLGDAFYKTRWTHLAKKLPFLLKGQANHSFRHTAIDAMKAAGIPSEIRADFAGHKLLSETEGRYSDAHMTLLREAAETIPKVTDGIAPVPINLLPDRLRVPRKARHNRDLSLRNYKQVFAFPPAVSSGCEFLSAVGIQTRPLVRHNLYYFNIIKSDK